MDFFSHSDRTEWLLLSWAFKHPYLYALIKTFNPALYIVIVLAGFKLMGFKNRTRRG
jgi:hypothetical protein